MMGGAAIATKLALSTIADRFGRARLLVAFCAMGAAVHVLFVSAGSYPMYIASTILFGISMSAITPLFYALIADSFEIRTIGTIMGMMSPVRAVFDIALVRAAGESYDRTGSYDMLFAALFVCNVLAIAMILLTRHRRFARSLPSASGPVNA